MGARNGRCSLPNPQKIANNYIFRDLVLSKCSALEFLNAVTTVVH